MSQQPFQIDGVVGHRDVGLSECVDEEPHTVLASPPARRQPVREVDAGWRRILEALRVAAMVATVAGDILADMAAFAALRPRAAARRA
jgi:hypothetical protein